MQNPTPQLTDQQAYEWFLNDIAQWGPTVADDPIALVRLLTFLAEHAAATHLFYDAANLCSQTPIRPADPHLMHVIRLARHLRHTHLRALTRRGLLVALTSPPPGAASWPRKPGGNTIYALAYQLKPCPDPSTAAEPESVNPRPSATSSRHPHP